MGREDLSVSFADTSPERGGKGQPGNPAPTAGGLVAGVFCGGSKPPPYGLPLRQVRSRRRERADTSVRPYGGGIGAQQNLAARYCTAGEERDNPPCRRSRHPPFARGARRPLRPFGAPPLKGEALKEKDTKGAGRLWTKKYYPERRWTL